MIREDWMGFSRTAVAVAVAVVAAAPALAQNTTAAVGGVVTGADGQPVAGAAVSILHVGSGASSQATTDAQGRYAARGLRAGGPYTITVSKAGLSEKREGVTLKLAETLNLDMTLGAAATTIVITGRAVSDKFNRDTMGAGTSLSSKDLAAFASIQRNLQDYARTDPRLAQTDKERGEISAAGQNSRYNSITIDGVTTNDTFGLESNNLPTKKQPISIDAIESVQVNLSNYDVTQKGYTGANINAVTKSGGNEFKGSVYYVFRDEGFTGKLYNNVTGAYTDYPAFDEDTKGFTLGGPIIKDKLFFFASYEQFKSSKTRPTFGPVGSSQTNVGITQSAIDEAIAIARNTWGMDVGTSTVPDSVELSVKDALLKLDWTINDQHRASLRYTKTEQTEPFLGGFSATGLSLSSYWYNQDKTIESLVGQWFADWSPNFSTELKVSKRNYDSTPTPVNGSKLPQIALRFDGALPPDAPAGTNANARFLNMGTERFRHFNVLSTETLDAYFGATWTLGAHELKFGGDYADNDTYNAFLPDTNGNYTFRCESRTYSFGAVNCNTANAATVQRAVMENFQQGNPSAYSVQLPLANRSLDDAVAVWSNGNIGLFVQDTWKVNSKFNLSGGLRLDQQQIPTAPLANATVAQPLVAGNVTNNVVTRNSGGFGMDNTHTLDGNVLFQPRLGFNWDLGTKERRMQLRGGVGLFQGAAANVWLSNPYSNTGMAVTTLSCTNFGACNTAGADFNPDPAHQPVLTGTPPAANVDILATGLEQPSVWKLNLGFESELPWGGLVAGAEWLHTKVKSGIFYEHLNLGGATATGPDGRQMFYTPQGYRGGTAAANYADACWNATGSMQTGGACNGARNKALSNPNFNNVMLAKETSKGDGDAITLSIGQPQAAGFGWSLAYTRTLATEVSPLTSSQSSSNWSNRNIFNPNEEVTSNSNYLTRDRISASLSWGKAFMASYRTQVGVFYEGRRGKPYSWTYLNDLNGDGVSGNDLMYIPSAPGSGEVTFRGGAAEEARFWEIVNANQGLSDAKGGIVGRNNNYAPWVNSFDLRLSQELPGFMKGHKTTLAFDILNFGNLLNKKWGHIEEIGFPSNRSFVNYAGLDANGKYVYSLGSLEQYTVRQTSGESQWAMQVTLRYEF